MFCDPIKWLLCLRLINLVHYTSHSNEPLYTISKYDIWQNNALHSYTCTHNTTIVCFIFTLPVSTTAYIWLCKLKVKITLQYIASCTNLSDDGLTENQDQNVQLSTDPPLSGSDASCQCSSSRLHWRHCCSKQAGLGLEKEWGRASTTHQGLWDVGGSQWGTWLCLLQRRQHSELAPVERGNETFTRYLLQWSRSSNYVARCAHRYLWCARVPLSAQLK